MIFFVLSGYVIAYVAAEREFSVLDFGISRIARVYSVVIPAIALTVIVDVLMLCIRPYWHAEEFISTIPAYQYRNFPEYLAMGLLFGNQVWGLRETLFSNGAYWSMCLEVYYYCMFAAAFYFVGAMRIVLLILILLCAGPGMLLRFHLWLFGYLVYRMHKAVRIRTSVARLLFVATATLMVVDLASDLNLRIDDWLDLITNGWVTHGVMRRFAGDTLTGLTIALNIFAAKYVGFNFGRIGSSFTYLASFSFSLYLMHGPLLRFWAAYWHPDPAVLVLLVLGSVWLIGQVTERQKESIRSLLRRASSVPARWTKSPRVKSNQQ
jgi:peptidoglycan/LPS O-acetylase OafA/YrhL